MSTDTASAPKSGSNPLASIWQKLASQIAGSWIGTFFSDLESAFPALQQVGSEFEQLFADSGLTSSTSSNSSATSSTPPVSANSSGDTHPSFNILAQAQQLVAAIAGFAAPDAASFSNLAEPGVAQTPILAVSHH